MNWVRDNRPEHMGAAMKAIGAAMQEHADETATLDELSGHQRD